VHRIEASILDHVPGQTILYSTREEFANALFHSLSQASVVAADFSETIPVGSFLDHGTALLAEACGCRLVPAENIVARCLGTLDTEGFRSHQEAAEVLFSAISEAWAVVTQRFGGMTSRKSALFEGELRDLIAQRISDAGLVSDGPPIVGAGIHSSNPHYSVTGRGSALAMDDVVQFDVWARKDSLGAVYADISWIGVIAPEPSPEQQRAFSAVVFAREEAIATLVSGLAEERAVRGADVDAVVRRTLAALGYGDFLRHRTGHSIGGCVHGFGVNLDSVEFPDRRVLPEGACFSIEPGVYLSEFGMRTEIDCVINGGKLQITGGERRQQTLLLLR
jgi:Xaa-Pro aminopeptidase